MLAKRIARILLAFLFFSPLLLSAQVTSSSITGTVRGTSEALSGATVSALHQPTGTVFRTASLTQGVFSLVNLIPGGPYRIEVTFVGYQPYRQDSLILALGENTRVDVTLTAASGTLTEVIVSSPSTTRRKTGASTNIGRQQIESMPT